MSTLLAALIALPASLACESRAELADLRRGLDLAIESHQLGDRPSLEADVRALEAQVPCLGNPLETADVARLHLVEGLLAWDPTDPSRALPYLAAAQRDAADGSAVALGLRPDDPVLAAWDAVTNLDEGRLTRLPPPARGRLTVDGRMAARSPTAAPYVLQLVRGGSVMTGGYVHPDAPPSAYPRLRPRLAVAGAVLGAGAAGTFLGGRASASTMETLRDSDASDLEDAPSLETLVKRNHALLLTAAATGAGAVGLFGAVLVVSL